MQNNPVNMIDPDGRLGFLVKQLISLATNMVANKLGRGNQLNLNEEDDYRKIQEENEEAYWQEYLKSEDDPWVKEYFNDLEKRIKEEEDRMRRRACSY